MIFTKTFYGCKKGDIYPTMFKVGEKCPEELVKAAEKAGVLEKPKARGKANADKAK